MGKQAAGEIPEAIFGAQRKRHTRTHEQVCEAESGHISQLRIMSKRYDKERQG